MNGKTMMQVVGVLAVGAGGFFAGRITSGPCDAPVATDPVGADVADRVESVVVSGTGAESDSSTASGEEGSTTSNVTVVKSKHAVVLPSEALSLLSSVRVTVPQGSLFESTDPVIDALGIVDQEKAKLQQAFRSASVALRKAEAGATRFEPDAGGVTMLTVAPTPGERNRLRDEFSAQAAEILGSDRGRAFVAIKGGDQLFGAGDVEKNYMVEETPNGYRISVMEGDRRRVLIGDSVPESLRHITDVAGINATPMPQVDDEE